jgi:hypothetical protein
MAPHGQVACNPADAGRSVDRSIACGGEGEGRGGVLGRDAAALTATQALTQRLFQPRTHSLHFLYLSATPTVSKAVRSLLRRSRGRLGDRATWTRGVRWWHRPRACCSGLGSWVCSPWDRCACPAALPVRRSGGRKRTMRDYARWGRARRRAPLGVGWRRSWHASQTAARASGPHAQAHGHLHPGGALGAARREHHDRGRAARLVRRPGARSSSALARAPRAARARCSLLGWGGGHGWGPAAPRLAMAHDLQRGVLTPAAS